MSNIFKKLLLNILIFISFLALPFSFVRAQQASQSWVCLKADQSAVHSASVSVDPNHKLLLNSNTYIFECLSSSECTSGDPAVDQEVFEKDNYTELNNQYGYVFEGSSLSSNPLMSDGAGEIPPFTWTSSTPDSHERRWLALNYYEPTSDVTGEEKTQQLGLLTIEQAFDEENCKGISWDPYGRVFDSSTLEPILGASVTLLKKRDNDVFTMMTPSDLLGGNIINPQITKEDGGYSFVVPDGTYKLAVSHNNYSFPEELNNIQSNYLKIYSDIYPAQTGIDIVQQGVIQHRDIPLKNISALAKNEVKLMQYFYDLDKINNTIIIKGRTSYPFTEIKAYSLKDDVRYRLLTENPIKADKMGNFILKVEQSKFDPTEVFGEITIQKTDLTSKNLVEQFNLATAVRFEPILNYVEGYAYDSTGKVLPNTTVSVYLEFSKKPYYQTVTDDKGFYKVSSEFLPSMPYHLNYTSTNGQILPTANSKFVAQNEVTITKSNIKINQFKNNKGEIIDASSNKNLNNPVNNNQAAKTNKFNTVFANKNYSQMIILGFIILFLIILVLSVLVYSRKKQIN